MKLRARASKIGAITLGCQAKALLLLPLLLSSQSSFSQQSDGATMTVLEDIIVTAQRRTEIINQVPVSVTAANAKALAAARVENIRNVDALSPSIQFYSANSPQATANIVVRGIGTVGVSRTFEGGVGVFVDGVYRTRAGAVMENFVDVNNLQILRSPQGTLFGKNTTSGAVLIDSASPEFGSTKGSYTLGVGNFGAKELRGSVNLGLSDDNAVRLAAFYTDKDSHFDQINIADDDFGKETKALKAQWLFNPNDRLSVRVIADTLNSDGRCCYNTVRIADDTGGIATAFYDAIASTGGKATPSRNIEDYQTGITRSNEQEVNDRGVTVKVAYELDAGTINSITAYRNYESIQLDSDADFEAFDLFGLDESFDSDFFSQELTFSGEIDSLAADYVVGAFYSDESIDFTRDIYWGNDAETLWAAVLGPAGVPSFAYDASPGLTASEVMQGSSESLAVFAHSNFELSEKWGLTSGLRYSSEEKSGSFAYSFFNFASPTVITGVAPGPAYNESQKDTAFSGTLGVDYRPTPETLLYLSYNRGFKAGGVNIDADAGGGAANNPLIFGALALPALDPTFEPELATTYELGYKARYWNGRAQTNIAAFYNDIEDLQVASFEGTQFNIFNAESATSYGIEIENLFQLSESVAASIDGMWLPEAEYGDDPALGPALRGQRLKFAPKISANAAVNLDRNISERLSLVGRLQYQYRSSQFINITALTEEDSLSIWNGNIGIRSNTGGWLVELWVQNLTDEVYKTFAFDATFQPGTTNSYLGAPRTFGMNVRGEF